MSLFVFNQGGPLMYLILLGSIIGLAVFLERIFHLYRARIDTDKLMDDIRSLIREGKLPQAIEVCRRTPGPVAHILSAGLACRTRDRSDIREAIEDAGVHEVPRMEKNMVVLATIAHISPLLGLLGTVMGMIKAFMTIEELEGVVNPSNLAGGIWEALMTTAFGLMVAILAYVAYNFLVARIGKMVLDMETSATEIVNLLTKRDVSE
ncbi:MAG: MotA/TolQ/ExbB proton channel family protein [Candidatus Auribacterota bacterium]|nr:MotA/TolQ/ExbB proton channel family protein [Candidatus Auribacterota bacterium]